MPGERCLVVQAGANFSLLRSATAAGPLAAAGRGAAAELGFQGDPQGAGGGTAPRGGSGNFGLSGDPTGSGGGAVAAAASMASSMAGPGQAIFGERAAGGEGGAWSLGSPVSQGSQQQTQQQLQQQPQQQPPPSERDRLYGARGKVHSLCAKSLGSSRFEAPHEQPHPRGGPPHLSLLQLCPGGRARHARQCGRRIG